MKASLEDKLWAKTDRSSGCWVWTGTRGPNGYGSIWFEGKTYRVHRKAYELAVGPIPSGLYIDHVCHTRLCVNPDHLRPVTPKENLENLAGAYGTSKSGVRGVSWVEARKKWTSNVMHNGKAIHVGRFDTIHEAEAAVIAKRNELFTHNDGDRLPKSA